MSSTDRGPYYNEMIALYDQFVQGRLESHYTSYFDKLKVYFTEGELITRIHALELILNIILGGKWTGVGSRPEAPELPSDMNLIQYKLQQIEKKWSSAENIKAIEIEEVNRRKIPVEEMINWLYEVLPKETNQNILKVYFIFIKTHWEHLSVEDISVFDQLYDLHKKLLDNKEYAKLEVMERLHRDGFSEGYHPLR